MRSPRCSGSGWPARCSSRSTRARPERERAHRARGDAPGGAADRARASSCSRIRHVYDPEVAFVTWTSGTTGAPKPVLHTHANYLELLDRVLAPLRGDRDRSRLRERTAAHPESRSGVARAERRDLQRLVRIAGRRRGRRHGPLRSARVRGAGRVGSRSARRCSRPRRWRCCPTTPAVVDLAPLRYVRSITAPLSPLQARRFADKFGVVVLNGYGQAEIGEVIGWTAADAREHPEKLGAVGRPHPGVAIRIAPRRTGSGRRRSTSVGCSCGRRRRRSASPRRASTPTATSTPATWPASTPTGSCGSKAARATSSTAAATRCSPSTSRKCCASFPVSPRPRSSALPDDRLGEIPVAYVVTTDGRRRRRSRRRVPRAPRAVQGPGRVPARRRAAAQRGRQGAAPRTRAALMPDTLQP